MNDKKISVEATVGLVRVRECWVNTERTTEGIIQAGYPETRSFPREDAHLAATIAVLGERSNEVFNFAIGQRVRVTIEAMDDETLKVEA